MIRKLVGKIVDKMISPLVDIENKFEDKKDEVKMYFLPGSEFNFKLNFYLFFKKIFNKIKIKWD